MNKDEITKTLCINRDKPQMKCNGKCHLKKQFKNQDEQEKSIPLNLKENSEIILFFEKEYILTNDCINNFIDIQFKSYQCNLIEGSRTSIFQPPKSI